jgi:NAD(P)H-flavin reductase
MHEAEVVNPYLPRLLRIAGMRDETSDVRTLELEFAGDDERRGFEGWHPGQFAEFTVFGAGECVFALSNDWTSQLASEPDATRLECTFRAIGKVTNALRSLSAGEVVGFRGPYGNHFPVSEWKGHDLVFLGGGIGMAALRAALVFVLENRDDYGDVVIVNGARSADDMVYAKEMEQWRRVAGVRVVKTVDPGGEDEDWNGEVGLLPNVFEGLGLEPDGRIVVACGPPIMLHYLFLTLGQLGYQRDQVVTTLENKMKCGIGHCGRCNIGPFYVCRDGPVVTWGELEALPKDY